MACKLAEAAVNIVGVKACSIRLLDDDTNDLNMRSTFGLSEKYRNKGVVSKMDPVIESAFQGEAVVVDNMGEDPRIRYPQATLQEGLVSQLTVALTFRSESIGECAPVASCVDNEGATSVDGTCPGSTHTHTRARAHTLLIAASPRW